MKSAGTVWPSLYRQFPGTLLTCSTDHRALAPAPLGQFRLVKGRLDQVVPQANLPALKFCSPTSGLTGGTMSLTSEQAGVLSQGTPWPLLREAKRPSSSRSQPGVCSPLGKRVHLPSGRERHLSLTSWTIPVLGHIPEAPIAPFGVQPPFCPMTHLSPLPTHQVQQEWGGWLARSTVLSPTAAPDLTSCYLSVQSSPPAADGR